MIVTPSMLENSKRVLRMPADGSKANEQARARAKKIILSHADNLERFLQKKPNSPIALIVCLEIINLVDLSR